MPSHLLSDSTHTANHRKHPPSGRRRSRQSEDYVGYHRVGREPTAPRDGSSTYTSPVWRLGLLRDRTGHVHLVAVLQRAGQVPEYLDLLAAVGAATPADLDLDELVILVHGEQIQQFSSLVERCVEDVRLRRRLIELANASTLAVRSSAWTV